ncbi:MAG: carbon monoxide dehydrogenase subunit G [Bauldia sp.]|nr:carbon monoxide dehydrogenase subunit G [Bauldia sp.]
MEMSGEYRIAAPRAKVWAALNDPLVLKESIPGCTELTKLSDTEMSAVVQAKVGMVRATFTGAVILTNLDPPTSYTITGEGKGGVAGFAKGGADVTLVEEGPNTTLLKYTAKGQVGGKIAQIGARLIDATAKQMADQFFAKFTEKVGGAAAAAAESTIERVEHAVEHAVEEAAHTVAEAEEEVEKAAVTGFLGGPQMWALLALIAGIVLIIIFR